MPELGGSQNSVPEELRTGRSPAEVCSLSIAWPLKGAWDPARHAWPLSETHGESLTPPPSGWTLRGPGSRSVQIEGNVRSGDQILPPKNKQFLVISGNCTVTFVVPTQLFIIRNFFLEERTGRVAGLWSKSSSTTGFSSWRPDPDCRTETFYSLSKVQAFISCALWPPHCTKIPPIPASNVDYIAAFRAFNFLCC